MKRTKVRPRPVAIGKGLGEILAVMLGKRTETQSKKHTSKANTMVNRRGCATVGMCRNSRRPASCISRLKYCHTPPSVR